MTFNALALGTDKGVMSRGIEVVQSAHGAKGFALLWARDDPGYQFARAPLLRYHVGRSNPEASWLPSLILDYPAGVPVPAYFANSQVPGENADVL